MNFVGYLGGSEDYYTRMWGVGYDLHIANGTHSEVDWADKGPYSTYIWASRAQDIINNHAEKTAKKVSVGVALVLLI